MDTSFFSFDMLQSFLLTDVAMQFPMEMDSIRIKQYNHWLISWGLSGSRPCIGGTAVAAQNLACQTPVKVPFCCCPLLHEARKRELVINFGKPQNNRYIDMTGIDWVHSVLEHSTAPCPELLQCFLSLQVACTSLQWLPKLPATGILAHRLEPGVIVVHAVIDQFIHHVSRITLPSFPMLLVGRVQTKATMLGRTEC